MNPRRWLSTVRGWLARRRGNGHATPAELETIRRKMAGEPAIEALPQRPWPGFSARKQMSTFDFVMYIRTHKEMQPSMNNRAGVRMVYEARLELLNDPHAPPSQKIEAMSGMSRIVAGGALENKDMNGFNKVLSDQIRHMQNRIKEFS